MVYRALGIMSGSSLDGLDLAFVEFHESAGKWDFALKARSCIQFPTEWKERLASAPTLSAFEYQLLHTAFGHFIGEKVNQFVIENNLEFQVQLISSHGHTCFHFPAQKMTAQIGDGAAIAAITGINTVTDLRSLDIALGGQGAPIVPVGEKLLWPGTDLFLNIGGIANLSVNTADGYLAFDVCPANRVLNMLAAENGYKYDAGGEMAAVGSIDESVLTTLNALDYYGQPYPKSLANEFGTETVFPIVKTTTTNYDALRTYSEHIALQIKTALQAVAQNTGQSLSGKSLLITGGGAHNTFLISRIQELTAELGISIVLPDANIIDFKEAIVMALLGVLRWREENTVLASVTGARRSSIGGAVWMGQEA